MEKIFEIYICATPKDLWVAITDPEIRSKYNFGAGVHSDWPRASVSSRWDSCRLTVTHDQLREGASDQLYGGWPMILSGLKTWLETGAY